MDLISFTKNKLFEIFKMALKFVFLFFVGLSQIKRVQTIIITNVIIVFQDDLQKSFELIFSNNILNNEIRKTQNIKHQFSSDHIIRINLISHTSQDQSSSKFFFLFETLGIKKARKKVCKSNEDQCN